MGLEHVAPLIANDMRITVRQDTWGHLAPSKNTTYNGYIVFAVGCYGDDELNPTVLDARFKRLSDSPWFFDAMAEFISKAARRRRGRVFRFDGTFRNFEFSGTVKQVWPER